MQRKTSTARGFTNTHSLASSETQKEKSSAVKDIAEVTSDKDFCKKDFSFVKREAL
jgi:hypothetical protein